MDSGKLIESARQLATGREEKEFVSAMELKQSEEGRITEHQKTLLQRVIAKHTPGYNARFR